jgi:hypothetical protein
MMLLMDRGRLIFGDANFLGRIAKKNRQFWHGSMCIHKRYSDITICSTTAVQSLYNCIWNEVIWGENCKFPYIEIIKQPWGWSTAIEFSGWIWVRVEITRCRCVCVILHWFDAWLLRILKKEFSKLLSHFATSLCLNHNLLVSAEWRLLEPWALKF